MAAYAVPRNYFIKTEVCTRTTIHTEYIVAFALWIENETAWAQGTHEYRPMGAAVIAATGQFRARDFRQDRRTPSRLHRSFAGLYASLEDVNRHLRQRRSQVAKKNFRKPNRPTPAYI